MHENEVEHSRELRESITFNEEIEHAEPALKLMQSISLRGRIKFESCYPSYVVS